MIASVLTILRNHAPGVSIIAWLLFWTMIMFIAKPEASPPVPLPEKKPAVKVEAVKPKAKARVAKAAQPPSPKKEEPQPQPEPTWRAPWVIIAK